MVREGMGVGNAGVRAGTVRRYGGHGVQVAVPGTC